jgi:RimJ/RimL family protein N-acetyltransferase
MTLLDRTAPETFRERSIAVLETERLILRAPRFEDAEAIATLVNDRRIAENTLRIPHPYALADARAFLTAANTGDGEIVFLICARDAAILGCCGIAKLDGQTPEIGYWLGVAFWGKGYATEAARAVIDHAFGELGYDTLLAGARVSNPASRRVLQKCGFQWTGVGLYRIRALASSAPCDRFRLDRGLWASLKSWGKMLDFNDPEGNGVELKGPVAG